MVGLDAPVELIDPAITYFNKRYTFISRNGSRQVTHVKDGTIFEADVVLGADGIRSTVRQAVSGDPEGKKRVVFTRTVAYRLWEGVK
jgi:salicylate hydroxylase